MTHPQRQRPKTILIAALSLCGQLGPKGFAGNEDRRFLEYMRDQTDASVIGAGTLRDENPEFRGTGGKLHPGRLRAIVSQSCELPTDRKIFETGPSPYIMTTQESAKRIPASLAEKCHVVLLPPAAGGVSIMEALIYLKNRGADTVLLEGGGRFNFACMEQQVVDDLFLTLTPVLGGHPGAPHLVSAPDTGTLPDWKQLRLIRCRHAATGEIFAHYQPVRIPAG